MLVVSPSAEQERRQVETVEIDLLLTGVARRSGYDFRRYARPSLTRRVRQAMKREGVATISALQERVLRDAECLTRFVEILSVHTTGMFRDPDFYLALRREVVPLLRTYPFIRIWHAGCSTGEEVYSLAILLQEEGLYDRCRLYATDISERVIDRARRGIYPLHAMREYTAAYQRAGGRQDFSSYYTADEKFAIFRERLRRNIIFAEHSLTVDGAFNDFQLVLCRNVMIYFDQELKQRVHDLLFASLTKFGILGLGKKESLRYSNLEPAFEELASRVRLYRRVG